MGHGKNWKASCCEPCSLINTCDRTYIDVAEKLPQVFQEGLDFVCTKVAFARSLLKIILLLIGFYESMFSVFGFYPAAVKLQLASCYYVLHRSLNTPQLK